MNPGNGDISGSSRHDVSLATLRENFATLYVTLEHMREVEGPELHARYVSLFGGENLTLFSLAVEATEMHSLIRLAERGPCNDDDDRKRIRKEAMASTIPYRRKMEVRSMEYIVSDVLGVDKAEDTRVMLDLLKRAVVMIFSACNPRPVTKSLFGKVEGSFRNRDARGIRSVIDSLREDSLACGRCAEREKRERESLGRALRIVGAEIDELNVTYPYIMRSRLADNAWISLEHDRLQREITNLRLKLDELSARVRELGF